MSIPDSLILHYFELCTKLSPEELVKIRKDFENPQINLRDLKARLAKEIVTIYHGAAKAQLAEREFNRIFKQGEIPREIASYKLKDRDLSILDLIIKLKLAPSKSEARRLIGQGGVRIILKIKNKKLKRVIKDWRETVKIEKGMIVQVGKRKFVKIE